MPDKKTVMSWLEGLTQDDWQSFHSDSEVQQIAMATLELLKEQKAQKFLVDENGKITPLPVVFPNCPLKEYETVVRCKDCKHRPKEPNWETYESGFDLEFPEGSKCPCRCGGDEWYSWYPEDDWFCANGER